jgi:hypothetical protein
MIASAAMGPPPIDATPAVTTSASPAPKSATPPGIVPASTCRISSSRKAVLTSAIVPLPATTIKPTAANAGPYGAIPSWHSLSTLGLIPYRRPAPAAGEIGIPPDAARGGLAATSMVEPGNARRTGAERPTGANPAPRWRCAMCQHQPRCPPADALDRAAAHVVASHPEQGWSLLCNGVVLFDDTGALLPDGQSVPPHRLAVTQARGCPLTLSGPVAA